MLNDNLFTWSPKKQQEKNLIRWIEALLSGDYQQGQNMLYNPVTKCHCATGVAARVFGFNFLFGQFYFGFDADNFDNVLDKYNIPQNWFERTFGDNLFVGYVTHLNDSGKSFAEIAAILVTYLPSSERRTELSFIIADKLADERTARQNMEQPIAPAT